MMNPYEMRDMKALVQKWFKNSKGLPFELTDGQAELFSLVFKRKHPRNHIETHTRYGKSDVLSMGALMLVNNWPIKLAVVAGNKEKSRIIMNYAIGHIFDSEDMVARFMHEKNESLENIRRFRNKDRINFDLGKGRMGEMFITTAPAALGFGATHVIEDESALIPDNEHALVMRMLGDQPENYLWKVGNPWDMEHFRKSFEDPAYHKLVIDYKQGIREGRLTPQYVDEMKKQPFFDVLYECKFPKSGTIDDKGWVPLFSREEIDRAMVDDAQGFGIKKLGIDVAGGGRNFSVIVKRYTNFAEVIHKTQDPDTMNLAEKVVMLSKDFTKERKYLIQPDDIFTDVVGIGKGLYDILAREIPGIYGVNVGSEPTGQEEKDKFINLRAEIYWKMRDWILKGGKLKRHEDWSQLLKIKYRSKLEGRHGKLQIISKEEMAKEGTPSPDAADALALTFRTPDLVPQSEEDMQREQDKMEKMDPFNPFGL